MPLNELYLNRNNSDRAMSDFYKEALKTGKKIGIKLVTALCKASLRATMRNELEWIVNGTILKSLDGCARAVKYISCYLLNLRWDIIDFRRGLESRWRRIIPLTQLQNINRINENHINDFVDSLTFHYLNSNGIQEEREFNKNYLKNLVQSILQELPAKRKRVMDLYLEGYHFADIARQMNISVSTARNHKFKACAYIKRRILEMHPDINDLLNGD